MNLVFESLLKQLTPHVAVSILQAAERATSLELFVISEMQRAGWGLQDHTDTELKGVAAVCAAARADYLDTQQATLTATLALIQQLREDAKQRTEVIESTRFVVEEHINGFSLEDTETGESAWLSDGVDSVPDPADSDNFLPPGGKQFCRLWAAMFNSDVAETLAAYFPGSKEEQDGV